MTASDDLIMNSDSSLKVPPAVPEAAVYTSSYCEENIYLLAQAFLADPLIAGLWNIFAIFISNQSQTVALWSQKLSKNHERPVVWDYHVVLMLTQRESLTNSWIYDFDSTLRCPCQRAEYIDMTFSPDLLPQYQSKLRVIPATLYIDSFASDRSHMLRHGQYISPPPSYKPIAGSWAMSNGVTNNLMKNYICMDAVEDGEDERYGRVMDSAFEVWHV